MSWARAQKYTPVRFQSSYPFIIYIFGAVAPCQLAWHKPEFCQLEKDARPPAFPQPLAVDGGERLGMGYLATIELTSKLVHP